MLKPRAPFVAATSGVCADRRFRGPTSFSLFPLSVFLPSRRDQIQPIPVPASTVDAGRIVDGAHRRNAVPKRWSASCHDKGLGL